MTDPRPRPDSLEAVLASVWTELEIGAAKAKHGFHQPVLATTDADGTPSARTVVLRKADRHLGLVACHTDARAQKLAHLRQQPTAAWCFYDKGRRIQVRAFGSATVHTEDSVADEHWERSPTRSRRCYLAPAVPGSVSSSASPNLPDALLDREPTPEESEAGRPNFAVVRCRLHKLDYLELHHAGHVRARFIRPAEDRWAGEWIEP